MSDVRYYLDDAGWRIMLNGVLLAERFRSSHEATDYLQATYERPIKDVPARHPDDARLTTRPDCLPRRGLPLLTHLRPERYLPG